MRLEELKEVRERIKDNKNISDEDKKRLLSEISEGKEFGFGTGYPTIDRPWLQFLDMDKYDFVNDKTVYQDIVDVNKDYLDNLAIMYFGGKVSYDKLFKKIDQVAKSLEEYGIKKGDFVTVCSAGTPELIYVFYALAKIGAVANLMAPNFDSKQMIDRINDCESNTIIVMDTFYPAIKDTISKSNIEKTIVVPSLNSSPLRFFKKQSGLKLNYANELWWNQFLKDGKKRIVPETFEYEKDYPLCMVYSSGTTGAAKAILLSHDSFQNSVLSYDANSLDMYRGQVFYHVIPPWYSTGLNTSIHLPFHKGLTVFQDPRFQRDVFVNNIINNKIDLTVASTSLYEGFLDENLIKGKKVRGFSTPFEGGEPLSHELKGRIEDNLRKMGCDTTIRIGYGQCECGAAATTQTQNIDHPDGSVGVPIPGAQISIFDDDFNELKYNERGNILISTRAGMMGYYKKPEATEKYFYTDKFGRKWSCTGDIGYLGECGDLFIEGRKEDCSYVNGKKIYNFDIENAIKDESDIEICDCVSMISDGVEEGFALHIIFDKSKRDEYINNPDKLYNFFTKLQKKIYDKYQDIDMVPSHFKVRESFPIKPFGKRDTEAIKRETDGFIIVDKSNIVEKNKQKVKKDLK